MQRRVVRGLDLEIYGRDVRRIFCWHFAWRCRRAGLDSRDVLHDIYASILTRNAGDHPFDATRSAPTTWIYAVCRSVVSNKIDQAERRRKHEEGPGAERDHAELLEESRCEISVEDQARAREIWEQARAARDGRGEGAWRRRR